MVVAERHEEKECAKSPKYFSLRPSKSPQRSAFTRAENNAISENKLAVWKLLIVCGGRKIIFGHLIFMLFKPPEKRAKENNYNTMKVLTGENCFLNWLVLSFLNRINKAG